MPDDPLEIVIREQLTIMGVDNAYHRAAAIALAVRREEPKGHHPTCSPGDCRCPAPCCHPSSTGIDQTDGPEKVWRCDACGWLHVDTLGADGITREADALAAEVSALRAALERIAGVDRTAEHAAYAERNAARIARDALGRYPKEAG